MYLRTGVRARAVGAVEPGAAGCAANSARRSSGSQRGSSSGLAAVRGGRAAVERRSSSGLAAVRGGRAAVRRRSSGGCASRGWSSGFGCGGGGSSVPAARLQLRRRLVNDSLYCTSDEALKDVDEDMPVRWCIFSGVHAIPQLWHWPRAAE